MVWFELNTDSTGANLDSLKMQQDTIQDTLGQAQFFGIPNRGTLPQHPATPQNQTTQEVVLYEGNGRPVVLESWQTILLLFSFFLIGFVHAFNRNRTIQSIRAIFNYVVAQEIVREEKVFFHRTNLVLSLVHILNAGLFIHFVLSNYGWSGDIKGVKLFGLIVGLIALTYLIKYLFSQVLFFVFKGGNLAIEYVFTICLYNNLMGVVLLPFLAFNYYTTWDSFVLTKFVVLPMVILILLFRLIRLFVIGKDNGVSYLYIFLYICTLEILPLVVLYRIFILE